MASYPDRCQHLKINGTQCGSPALRRNRFCFFHKRFQDERIRLAADRKRRGVATFILPVLEDANSIQMALQQVMRLLVSHDMDHKTASLLLYALQTASSNLRQTRFEAFKHDIILDPRDAADSPLGSTLWEDEDFEEEEEDDPETTRVEAAAERAAEAIREKHRQQKAKEERLKKFYLQYPHLKPKEEQAPQPANPPQPAANHPQTPQAQSSANLESTGPGTSNSQVAPKKQPLPTTEEFQQDIHDLARKHFLPGMPDEVYKMAIKKGS
jgi:outer membrane biosynthesis protein TonB